MCGDFSHNSTLNLILATKRNMWTARAFAGGSLDLARCVKILQVISYVELGAAAGTECRICERYAGRHADVR